MSKKKMTFCNPLDLGYRYQHFLDGDRRYANREGADPTLIYFKGRYYVFVSMSAGFWHSEDLMNWEFHANDQLLIQDYAPDVRQIGEYLYFCASRREVNCPILRTLDPLSDEFTEVSAPFSFWDPDVFCDDDGRVYFYWGCTNTDPIYGVEMDPETMQPIGEKQCLIYGRETELGYERAGENGVVHKEDSLVYQHLSKLINPETGEVEIPEELAAVGGPYANKEVLTALLRSVGRPYIEGAYMTKYQGKYYLQYACPGTEYNTYSDGVYVGDKPLGPFALQASNPFSSKPGGFIAAAGHGSTIADAHGNYWHASTMRISVNHSFERRIGLFPAGFDEDGVMFCNQNFADYPFRIPEGKFDARNWKPEWMLLSFRKPVTASSTAPGSDPALAVNEDIRTWWSAGGADQGEWLTVDLEEIKDVRAVQVNLADQDVAVQFPDELYSGDGTRRHIELEPQLTRFTLEVSQDGEAWEVLERVERECSNAYLEYPDGVKARYVRLTGGELPYGQTLRVSGLRIFGKGGGKKPIAVKASALRLGDMDARVQWEAVEGAQGYNVRYGIAPDKLYMSWLVYDVTQLQLSTLIKGQDYYLCVDSFNENGITEGEVFAL